MAGETILIVDAGPDIDERMTTTLEAESYLTYTVSSQDVNAQLADLLKPSLIYVKPPDLKPTGLDPCKAIHGIPLLMKVPIVILVPLTKPLGPQYLEEYGIVDFLKPTFSKEELVEKTGTILGKTPFSRQPKVEEPAELQAVKGTEKKGTEKKETEKKETEKKRFTLPLPAIGIIVAIGIAGVGYIAYQQFMPNQKVPPSPAVKAPVRITSVAPKAGVKPQMPATSNVASVPANPPAATPDPAPSVPSTPPVQPSSASSENVSQPPVKPFFSVQLGAFRDEEMAQALAKKFKEKGYDAFTQPGVTRDKAPIYRVLVNKYEDRRAAQKMAGEIQTKEQVKTTLYGE